MGNRTNEDMSSQRITWKKEFETWHLAETKRTVMYKVEALSKQVHTLESNAHKPNTHTRMLVYLKRATTAGPRRLHQPESMLKSSMPCGLQCRPTPELNTSDQT